MYLNISCGKSTILVNYVVFLQVSFLHRKCFLAWCVGQCNQHNQSVKGFVHCAIGIIDKFPSSQKLGTSQLKPIPQPDTPPIRPFKHAGEDKKFAQLAISILQVGVSTMFNIVKRTKIPCTKTSYWHLRIAEN